MWRHLSQSSLPPNKTPPDVGFSLQHHRCGSHGFHSGDFHRPPIGNLSCVRRNTAGEFSKGDVSTSVRGRYPSEGGAAAALAIETARINLQQTLTNLKREKAWVNHLLESIVEGIFALDHQGRISFFSKGAEQITGWSRNEVLGLSFDQVFRLVDTETSSHDWIPTPGARKKMIVKLYGGRQATLSFTGAQLAPAEAGDTQVALVSAMSAKKKLSVTF